jgi:hypothetical protein
MGDDAARNPSQDDETEHERRTRQLSELLQEARVAMPGVQVLFGFLLAVVFQARFAKVTTLQKDLFLAAILCATASTVCFIAPAAYHRILFERRDKPHLISVGNRFLIVGVAFLALAMTLALALVCDVIFGGTTAAIVAAIVFVAFAWFWFGFPVSRRLRGARSH